jgi:hypothetical protein
MKVNFSHPLFIFTLKNSLTTVDSQTFISSLG